MISFLFEKNGDNIEITNENKKEYVDLYINFILMKEIENKSMNFVLGFIDWWN